MSALFLKPKPSPVKFEPAQLVSTELILGEKNSVPLFGSLIDGVVVVDTETTGLYPHLGHRPFLVGLANVDGKTIILEQNSIVQPKLAALLSNPGIIKVGHNIKFDIRMLRAVGYGIVGPFIDTMELTRLANERYTSYALKRLAVNVLGEGVEEETGVKDWLKVENRRRRKMSKKYDLEYKESNYSDVPREIMKPYLAKDLEYTMKLLYAAGPRVMSQTPDPSMPACEMDLIDVIADMEDRGIAVSTEYFIDKADKAKVEIKDIEKDLAKQAGKPVNVRSLRQLGDILFKKFGLTCLEYTDNVKNPQPKLDAETLSMYDHPFARAVMQHRKKSKLLTTYYRPLADKALEGGGIIHPSFRQNGAITGRFSCADPNLQNIPRKDKTVRTGFVCRPGYVNFYADYQAIEMRLFAHYARSKSLIESIEAGGDPHADTALLLFGESFANAKEKLRDILRFVGKTINFGVVYGMGKRALRKQLRKRVLEELDYWDGVPEPQLLRLANITEAEASSLLRAYFRQYPDVKRFMDEVQHELYRKGHIADVYGRLYRVPIKEAYKSVNYLIQGSAAGVIKRAMVRVHEALKRELPTAHLINSVHDELVVEFPLKDSVRMVSKGDIELEAVQSWLEGLMEDHNTFALPITVDVSYSTGSWAEKRPVGEAQKTEAKLASKNRQKPRMVP